MPPKQKGRKVPDQPPPRSTPKPVTTDSDIAQVFMGEGAEPLTEELIQTLIAQGWEEAMLREAAREGGQYSRPRNSIVFPAQFEGF